MSFELTEEQSMFQKFIRDFAEKEIAPIVDEAEENEECPREVFSKLGKLGYLCPAYPPEYEGGGLGKIGDCILCEEVASVCSGINSGLAAQSGLATSAILAHGSEDQKQKFLIPAVRGEKIAAFGLTEPNAGSDVASIETTAKRKGDHYVINGSKMYITNGTICDFTTLAVYTDKSQRRKGISVILVERGTPGFSTLRMKASGFRSASGAELVFEDCHVPVGNLVGEEGQGFTYLMESLNGGRITHSAGSVGRARAAYEAALSYAKERHQFGKPIGKYQDIAFKLAYLATEIEAARWFVYRVAWLYSQGERVAKEAAMTKLFSSEVAIRAAEVSMRIHAGAGYLAEAPVHRYFRDNILSHATEGTTEIQKMVISRELGL